MTGRHYKGIVIAVLASAAMLAIWREKSANASLGMPPTVRIPIVRAHGKGDPPQAALYSHWSHDQFACYVCHPTLFPQQRMGFTHDDMDAWKFCASCHDGKSAWSFDDADCETCHRN